MHKEEFFVSVDAVRTYLSAYGLAGRVMEFELSSATVELAAVAVGCEPAHIAKTLSFDAGGEAVLIVTAGDMKIDNPKYKAQFHTKAKMLSHEDALSRIGHAVGGVCPFAVNDGVQVYLDISLKRFDIVYPAAGSTSSAVKLTPAELEKASGGTWVDVCKEM